MDKFGQFEKDLKNFVEKEFKNEKYFCIIYGSYCYNLGTINSDVDLIIVAEKVSKQRVKRVVSKIRDLHHKFDRVLDDEVPHEIKGISDFKTLNLALKGRGFKSTCKRIIIPPIIKNKKFLRSREIKMRLLLNALTNKCIFVSGDNIIYNKKKEKARKNLVRLIFNYLPINSTSPQSFVKKIMGTKEKNGENFLGYKNVSVIRNYLTNSIKKTFDNLVIKGKMQKKGKRYFIKDEKWFKEILW